VQEATKERAILHLDLACFYAAIEVRDRPELKRNLFALKEQTIANPRK